MAKVENTFFLFLSDKLVMKKKMKGMLTCYKNSMILNFKKKHHSNKYIFALSCTQIKLLIELSWLEYTEGPIRTSALGVFLTITGDYPFSVSVLKQYNY